MWRCVVGRGVAGRIAGTLAVLAAVTAPAVGEQRHASAVDYEPAGQRASPPQAPAAAPADRRVLTITLGGDLGLGGGSQPVSPLGAIRHGTLHPWHELTSGLAPLISGDLGIANLESVVTDRNDLAPQPRTFNFTSHPVGVRHLTGLGLDVLTTANNHAGDFGLAGLAETIRHLGASESAGLAAWPGIGLGRAAASRPADVSRKGWRVRIAAIGIGGPGAPPETATAGARPAMLAYRSEADWAETVRRLADAAGDLRILSVHYGREMQVRPAPDDVRRLRDEAVRRAGIDLVAGHHAHVAAGVQEVDGRIVLYGLGNLLHPGMQDMGRFGICRDFGILARVHAVRDAAGRARIAAIEAIPLAEMHIRTVPLAGAQAALRIGVLNHHAAELDDPAAGARGVRFATTPEGRGLACLAGAEMLPEPVATLCRGWEPPPAPPPALEARLRAACGSGTAVASGATGEMRPRTLSRASRQPSAPTTAVGASLAARSRSLWQRLAEQ
jgi:poly-gamma-glutamate synthesis protein (capsule biosynthesis protein)